MSKTILILAANPKNTSQLCLHEEVRKIDKGLKRAHKRGKFVLRPVLAAKPDDLRRAMLDLKPDIVHFCGHGAGKNGIVLEDESGKAQLVGTKALADFFELFADHVECVVLNACYSEIQAKAISRHVRYVVGMKWAISDPAAIEFAEAFYDALGAGKKIKFAFDLACNAIGLEGLPESAIPVIKQMPPARERLSQREAHLSLADSEDVGTWGWSEEQLIKELIAISSETMRELGPEDIGDIANWVSIMMDHPDTWRLLVTGPRQIIGYWHFIPLFDEQYASAKNGRLIEGELTVDKIPLFELSGQYNVYFSTICIKKPFRRYAATCLLFKALFTHFTDLAKKKIFIREVCANAWTPEGEAICKSLKLDYLKEHRKAGKIYYAPFSKILKSEPLKRYPDLAKLYRQQQEPKRNI